MTSLDIATTLNAAGQWEVRRTDNEKTLLGIFKDTFCRDLFIDAVLKLVGPTDHNFGSVDVAAHSKKVQRPKMAAA